jgi:hypothetical protein
VVDGTGLSRGDRNGNERLRRLRELLAAQNAIVGVDLADVKRAAVVTDHDSRPGRLLPGPDSVPASLSTRPGKAVSEIGETERCGPLARAIRGLAAGAGRV